MDKTKSLKNKILLSSLLLMVIMILWLRTLPLQREKRILIISYDQSMTSSLNPSRLLTLSQMALKTTKGLRDDQISHTIITYTDGPKEAYQRIEEHIQKNNFMAIIGDISSSRTEYTSQLANNYKIPHLSFFATDDTIFEENPWSYSYRYRYRDEAEILLYLMVDYLGIKEVTLITCDIRSLYDRAKDLLLPMEEQDITIQDILLVEYPRIDFSQQIEQLKGIENLELLVSFLHEEQFYHFMQQLNQKLPYVPVLTPGLILHPLMLPTLIGLSNPLYSYAPYYYLKLGQDERLDTFLEEYQIALGVHRLDTMALWIYDGFLLLHELLGQVDTPLKLREALGAYEGNRLLGPIAFHQGGLINTNTLVPVKVHSGHYHEVLP